MPPQISTTLFDSFIFDIGNVVLKYDTSNPLLRRIVTTELWQNFELSGDDTHSIYTKLSTTLNVELAQIINVIEHTRDTVQVDTAMVEFICSLRGSSKTVIGLTNMPQPFYTYFREHYDFWTHFTDIYVSSEIGLRKPAPEAFQHVIRAAGLNPSRTLVIDDTAENVASARHLGLKAIHFDQSIDLLAAIQSSTIQTNNSQQLDATSQVLFTPSKRSWLQSAIAFLRKSWDLEEGFTTYASHHLHLIDDPQPIPADVFCTLLIYAVLPPDLLSPVFNQSIKDFLCRNHHPSGLNYFFVDRNLTSPTGIGAEADTAAMYLTVLLEHGLIEHDTIANATRQIAHNTVDSGIIQVFFPPRGTREGRIDTVVCANVLAFLYKYGYAETLQATEDYLYNELQSGQYLHGSQNYTNASTILFSITRATIQFGPLRVQTRFRRLLEQSIKQVLNQTIVGDLDLAMRMIVAKQLGIAQTKMADLETLLSSHQREDGSWPKQSLYRTVRSRLHFGAESLTTAFAIRALTSNALTS